MRPIITFILAILGVVFPLSGIAQQQTVIIDTPGSGTWTVPCGVNFITIAVYGGGGGGGGSNSNTIGGGGGGAGGYAEASFFVAPGTPIPYLVGAGGSGGGPAGNGGAGGQSNIQPFSGLTAFGGAGGFCENLGGGGGAGGTGSGWATNVTGGTGGNGVDPNGGSGGSAGGPNGGGGGSGGGAGVPGGPGGIYGGGGGGAGKKNGGINPSGGAGANGAVIITFTPPYDYPNAGGPYPITCNVTTLNGNTPSAGWSGQWVPISGAPPTFSDPTDPNSTVSLAVPGTCATIAWVFSSAGCTDIGDTVTICYPLLCNDEPCGGADVPLTVNSGSCSYTTYSNIQATGSVGMVEPGCGDYTDNDAWYEVTVPASGTVTVSATDAAGGAAMTMGLSIYSEGANCLDVIHEGCDFATSSADVAELTYSGTPGETIYVRIWETSGAEGQYDVCAFETAAPTGQISPGSSTVTCGSTFSFFDPGGDGGNYQNNTTTSYVLCPDTPGQYVSIDFSTGANFFNTEANNDYLTILDGATDTASIIGQYSGSVNPLIITSGAPDGCLTLIFSTDNAITLAGWEATVSCSAVAGVNDTICTATSCPGECGQWICQTGLYPTENNGNIYEDMTIGSGGCFDDVGEVASHWFYFTALTSGTVEFSFAGPGGQDYNFAIYGPTMDGDPPCPQYSNDPPILCSQADVGNYVVGGLTGLSSTLGDGGSFEGPEGDGWLDPLNVIAGETYSMVMNIYQNGGPQPVIDMVIGGTGALDCTPVFLPVELVNFDGINQGNFNKVFWTTASELNNDYFTVERSINGFDWEVVGTVDGAGTTAHGRYYELDDLNPYFPVTYYRLSQTDFDGKNKFFDVISVTNDKQFEGGIVSELFPNPASTYATFTYTGEMDHLPLNVQVVNEVGNVVINNTFNNVYDGMPTTLRIDELASGMYHVVFTQGDKRATKKLSVIR